MALNKDRSTPRLEGSVFHFPMLAAAVGFVGGIAVLDSSGWLKPAVEATGLKCVGIFAERADNAAGENGDINGEVHGGVFRFDNSADSDEITKADIGNNCFLVNDHTVAKTGTGRSVAGRIMAVDAQGVWVAMGEAIVNAPGGAMLAANNLSDVGNKGTSRTNLGVYERLGTPAFTIGNETTGVRNVAIQLKDSLGADLAVSGVVRGYLAADNAGAALSALDLASVAIGTDGLLIAGAAETDFVLVSEADGDIDVTIDSNANGTLYLVLIMPDGKLVISGAITFAAAE